MRGTLDMAGMTNGEEGRGIILRYFDAVRTLLDSYEEVSQGNNMTEVTCMIQAFTRNIRTLECIIDEVQASGVDEVQTIRDLVALRDGLLTLRSGMQGAFGVRSCTELCSLHDQYTGMEVGRGPGRPKFKIDLEQVGYLLQSGFNLSTVSAMFNVHRTTMWRHMSQNGMQFRRHTQISDAELRCAMQHIYNTHVHCGVTMMQGHLRSRGIVAQRHRIRNILHDIDPANAALRWSLAIRRRVYSVPNANYLWHVDTHHALIRWRLVTAGCIDGFSRLIVLLTVSDNNRADTMLELFESAVQNYGCPSRVRGDRGVENVGIQQYMERVRGLNRGSFIPGRSVHNTRIERLWRDVMYAVIQTYYSMSNA